jgi:hypothetical protein
MAAGFRIYCKAAGAKLMTVHTGFGSKLLLISLSESMPCIAFGKKLI